MSQFSKTQLLAPALLLAATLGGCATQYQNNSYLDGRDQISLSAGDANASNIVTQMVDPWPAYAGNKTIAYNGQRMQAAAERYRNGQVITPVGISASGVYQQPPAANPGGGGAGAAPVGPTVTQVK